MKVSTPALKEIAVSRVDQGEGRDRRVMAFATAGVSVGAQSVGIRRADTGHRHMGPCCPGRASPPRVIVKSSSLSPSS